MPVGTHQVCTRARDTGVGSDTSLGCKTVKVGSGSPFGSVDQVKAVPGGIVASGWAIDPDTSASIAVHAYVDAKGTALTADGSRPDVAAAFQGYGPAHGYTATLPASPGAHQVCLYGINVGGGANSSLGCRTVVVPGGSPVGSLDAANLVPGVGVSVGGWALDPDTASSIAVHVYVDGKGTALTANGDRSGHRRTRSPGYGSAHGFSATVAMTPGSHTVCAYGINVGTGANSVLGCSTVFMPTGSPIGVLDVARGGPGWVSVGGWAVGSGQRGSDRGACLRGLAGRCVHGWG